MSSRRLCIILVMNSCTWNYPATAGFDSLYVQNYKIHSFCLLDLQEKNLKFSREFYLLIFFPLLLNHLPACKQGLLSETGNTSWDFGISSL